MSQILTAERTLYEDIWTSVESYANHAPGQHNLPLFLDIVGQQRGTILDAGTGSGKGALALKAAGFEVYTCDVTNAGMVPEAKDLPFQEACLWHDLRSLANNSGYWGRSKFSFVYCCFPAGTEVRGARATIEHLVKGDEVTGRDGSTQRVVAPMSRLYTGELVRLSVACVPDVSVTSEHPVLVSRVRRIHRRRNSAKGKSVYEQVADTPEWRHAGDLRVGDWVLLPRLKTNRVEKVEFVAGKRNGKRIVRHELTEGAAWLLGMYVAEGSTRYGKGARLGAGVAVFSLADDERAIADRIVSELSALSVTASVSQPPSVRKMHGLRVHASSIGFSKMLDDWCGKGAASKKVPQAIKTASEPLIRSFLMGLVEGDGCLRKFQGYEYYSFVTVSSELACGAQELLFKIGIPCGIANPVRGGSTTFQGRPIRTLPAYTVYWSKRAWDKRENANGKAPYGRARFIGDDVYLPVTAVTKEPVFDLPVYNIETTDHTYGVPFVVHNCDVLEHIPTQFTMLAIDQMLRVARYGLFLSVSLVPDSFGVWAGKSLHNTVQPFVWWRDSLKELGTVEDARDLINDAVFFVRPRG